MSTPMKSTRAPGNDLVQTAVGSVAAARADLTRQAEELMQRNALLGRQRDSLAESTISFADYSKLLRQEIQALGEQYAHGLVGHESGSHPDMDMTWSDLQSGVIPEFTALLGAPLTMGALCFLFPDLVYQRFSEALEKYSAAWPSNCEVPYAERATLIAGLDRQRKDLMNQRREVGRQEEALLKAVVTR